MNVTRFLAAIWIVLIFPVAGLGWALDTVGLDPLWFYASAKLLVSCVPVCALILYPEAKKKPEAPP